MSDDGSILIHVWENLVHISLLIWPASILPPVIMTSSSRAGTKGKSIRQYMQNKWAMLQDGKLVVITPDIGIDGEFMIQHYLQPVAVTSDKSVAKNEKPGVKLVITMADGRKQRFYLENYQPFSESDRKMDDVVELNGESNVGKLLRLFLACYFLAFVFYYGIFNIFF